MGQHTRGLKLLQKPLITRLAIQTSVGIAALTLVNPAQAGSIVVTTRRVVRPVGGRVIVAPVVVRRPVVIHRPVYHFPRRHPGIWIHPGSVRVVYRSTEIHYSSTTQIYTAPGTNVDITLSHPHRGDTHISVSTPPADPAPWALTPWSAEEWAPNEWILESTDATALVPSIEYTDVGLQNSVPLTPTQPAPTEATPMPANPIPPSAPPSDAMPGETRRLEVPNPFDRSVGELLEEN